ncbi:hypothetical protein OAD66_05415 [Bacteroidia bacterium]|nr:hypothetical protein [Bacteroidia bacterium]MDB4106891.1 hypothetical protein [Bacteroidia bacterium]MDB9882554.1 hypothetical protein [Bacteroidia bacterium]
MINKLTSEIHQNAVSKGFYADERNIGEILCLIHSEVSEALEADRDNRFLRSDLSDVLKLDDSAFVAKFEKTTKNTFEDELADILIRVMDLAGYKDIDLEKHLEAKMRYNALRSFKHGKKY